MVGVICGIHDDMLRTYQPFDQPARLRAFQGLTRPHWGYAPPFPPIDRGVMTVRIGNPRASTAAWIFVPSHSLQANDCPTARQHIRRMCERGQWSGHLWSDQYRQRQALPLTDRRLRSNLPRGDQHIFKVGVCT